MINHFSFELSESASIGQYSNMVKILEYTFFFYISNTFKSNIRLKLAKNQAKAKQHPEAELLLFENYWLSSPTLSSKNNRRYFKNCTKAKCTCFNEVI